MSTEEQIYCDVFWLEDLTNVEVSFDLVTFGLKYWNKEQELRKMQSEKIMTELVQELQEQYRKANLKKYIKTVIEIRDQCKNFLKKYSATAEEISIGEIGLSARVFHGLYRNGVATVNYQDLKQ